jgi:hypothetical protein
MVSPSSKYEDKASLLQVSTVNPSSKFVHFRS